MNVTVSFTMHDVHDKDLINWLKSCPRREKSRSIRQALRAQLASTGHGTISSVDIYRVVRSLERKLQAGAMLTKIESQDESSEPIDITNTLDNLGV